MGGDTREEKRELEDPSVHQFKRVGGWAKRTSRGICDGVIALAAVAFWPLSAEVSNKVPTGVGSGQIKSENIQITAFSVGRAFLLPLIVALGESTTAETLSQVKIDSPVEWIAIGLMAYYGLDAAAATWRTLGANDQLNNLK